MRNPARTKRRTLRPARAGRGKVWRAAGSVPNRQVAAPLASRTAGKDRSMSNRAKVPVTIVSTSTDSLARRLAWFGIVLGAVQVLAPGSVAQWLGIAGRRGR